jgi:hypothetical protein
MERWVRGLPGPWVKLMREIEKAAAEPAKKTI